MKKIFLPALLVFLISALMPAQQADASKKDNHFRFIVMGDSRPILAVLPQSPPFKRILWETDLIGPEFAVHVGDLVFGYMSESGELNRQYEDLRNTLAPIITPLHFAIGNHETASPGGEEHYEGKVGKLFYSFDRGRSHFIILDSDWAAIGDTGTLGEEQLAWLKEDLTTNKDAANIFVFLHKPLFQDATSGRSSWEDKKMRDEVHQMFIDNGNVKAVFGGHHHEYKYFVRDGIPQYITGGAGAESGNPEDGGFYHYLLVNVDDDEFEVKVVEPYRIWYDCEPECDGKNSDVKVTVVNSLYSIMPIRLHGVQVDVPKLPDNKKYQIRGASIKASRDNGDGTITLRVSVNMNSVVGYKFFTLEAVDTD